MPAASVAHPLDPATYLLRGGPLTSGLKFVPRPPSIRSYSKKPLFVFSLMAQLLGRFSVGAVGGPYPHPVEQPALGHLTPRPGGLPLGYIRESAACASTHTLGWVRLFLAMLGINDFARRLGLPSLFADLCKQVIKRCEHRLVIESDGALLGSRCYVRFAFGVGGGIDGGGRLPVGHLPDGEGSLVEAVTANVFERSPRDGQGALDRFTIC